MFKLVRFTIDTLGSVMLIGMTNDYKAFIAVWILHKASLSNDKAHRMCLIGLFVESHALHPFSIALLNLGGLVMIQPGQSCIEYKAMSKSFYC